MSADGQPLFDFSRAITKLDRGREHQAEFGRAVTDYLLETGQSLHPELREVKDGWAEFALATREPWEPIRPRTSAILGDAVYNARAGLNLLACALVTPPKPGAQWPQFPIWSKPPDANPVTGDALRVGGMPSGYVAIVDAAQPYRVDEAIRPTHPLHLLAQLANTDKHQDLLAISPNFTDLAVGFSTNEAPNATWQLPIRAPSAGSRVVARFRIPEDYADKLTSHFFKRQVSVTHQSLDRPGRPPDAIYLDAVSTLGGIYEFIDSMILRRFGDLNTSTP